MKFIKMIASAAAALIILSSCQDVFTASVFSFVETDISTMNDTQKVSYASDLLATGTAAELAEAYSAIEALLPDDYATADDLTADELELVLLAADLAVGSSGIGDAVTDALGMFTSGEEGGEASVDDIIAGIDTENLESAVTLIEAAEANGAALSSEQYTNAAAAQLLVVLADVEDLGVADPSELNDSIPEQAAVIADLEQALNWAEAGGMDPSMFGDGIEMPA